MALNGRANRAEQCPVSGVKQPCRRNPETADFDPQETCAGQDFRDAKMNQCGQRLRDRSPRGRSQPERVRRIGAP